MYMYMCWIESGKAGRRCKQLRYDHTCRRLSVDTSRKIRESVFKSAVPSLIFLTAYFLPSKRLIALTTTPYPPLPK